MTFALVRVGLPNIAAILALAMVPILSVTLGPAAGTNVIGPHTPATAVAITVATTNLATTRAN
jgi:hypothetical protein